MARRSRGEGSVFYREDKELWIASCWIERTEPDGKVVKKRIQAAAKTKSQALAKLEEIRSSFSGPGLVLFSGLLTDWLESKRSAVAPRTLECYVRTVESHIRPALGTLDLRKVDRKVLDKTIQEIAKSRGHRTAGLCVAILKNVFKYAAIRNLIERNPCLGLRAPKKPHQERRIPTREEIRKILDHLHGDRYEAAFYLMAYLGLRVGEVRGLKWSDIQPQSRTITIQRSVQRVPKDYSVESGRFKKISSHLAELPPKTSRSRRTLSLPIQVIAALRRRHEIQTREKLAAGDHWQDTGFIFTTQFGTPIDYQPLRERLNAAIKALGLPKFTIHSFRHATATYLLASGAQLSQVQQLLGHSQVGLTANLYGHVVPGASDAIVQEFADALDPSQRGLLIN